MMGSWRFHFTGIKMSSEFLKTYKRQFHSCEAWHPAQGSAIFNSVLTAEREWITELKTSCCSSPSNHGLIMLLMGTQRRVQGTSTDSWSFERSIHRAENNYKPNHLGEWI